MNNRVFISEWTPRTRKRVEEIVHSNAQAKKQSNMLNFEGSTTSSESLYNCANQPATPVGLVSYKSPVAAASLARPTAFSMISQAYHADLDDLLPDEPAECVRPARQLAALQYEHTLKTQAFKQLPAVEKHCSSSYIIDLEQPRSANRFAASHYPAAVETEFLKHFFTRTVDFLQGGNYHGAAKVFGLVKRVFELYNGLFEIEEQFATRQFAILHNLAEARTNASHERQCLMEIITRGMEGILAAGGPQQRAQNWLETATARLDAAERALDLLVLLTASRAF